MSERETPTHLVIGAGEVGAALADVLHPHHRTHIRDIADNDGGPIRADTLHICYPWSETFTADTLRYQAQYNPSLVIVHSTVPVGTCDPHHWVHSPIRGKHPDLTTGIATFAKHLGGHLASQAAEAFTQCGITPVIHPRARDTEAGKLWELTQYGLQIAICKQIHDWCQVNDIDFHTVYTAFAITYNHGWARLGQPQYTRPLLVPTPGTIGGHCVVQGSTLLDHPLTDMVRDAGH